MGSQVSIEQLRKKQVQEYHSLASAYFQLKSEEEKRQSLCQFFDTKLKALDYELLQQLQPGGYVVDGDLKLSNDFFDWIFCDDKRRRVSVDGRHIFSIILDERCIKLQNVSLNTLQKEKDNICKTLLKLFGRNTRPTSLKPESSLVTMVPNDDENEVDSLLVNLSEKMD